MYFKLTTSVDQPHSLDLEYEYFNTKSDAQNKIDSNYIPKNSVSYHVSESSSSGAYSRYFTIEKKSSELGDSNGDYLLLYYNFNGEIKFENTKSSGETKIAIILIVVFVVFFVVIVVILFICFCCCRRRRSYGYVQSAYPVMPMPMYGQGPIYVQQPGYQQRQVFVQPQGQMIVQQGQINTQNGNNALLYPQQVVVSNNYQVAAAPYNNANNQNNPIPYNNRINIPQTPGGQAPQSKDYLNK